MTALLAVRNDTRSTALGDAVRLADRWWMRLRGLAWQRPIRPGEGMLLVPCASIHTFGMRGPLDVAFLDREGRVVSVYHALPARRWTAIQPAARFALELPAGTLRQTGTGPGDLVTWSALKAPQAR